MKTRTTLIALLFASSVASAATASEVWEGYLDYAYVYSSATPETLSQRLVEYGKDAGSPLDVFIEDQSNMGLEPGNALEEDVVRRRAIAHLLKYLAERDSVALEKSVESIRMLEKRLARHENRYWYHYIHAHQALEKGRSLDFVKQVLSLWVEVVVPLENHFKTLDTLSLDEAPYAGFSSSVPYLHENVARLVLIRSQEMGMDRDLDPLGSIVRLLDEGRVGAYPDVIPLAASSQGYLDRIVERLDGPESDGGSLTFTLALFEAAKHHDRARGLLATEGLGPATLQAFGLTTHAYETAFDRAQTLQGRCAVYTRGLRQFGEIYAAKQRLGVDPEIEMPVSIEGAIRTYDLLYTAREGAWEDIGYARTGRPSYVDAVHGLWEEIQEAVLNAADYTLAQSQKETQRADDHSRNAAQLYARYLSFFLTYANEKDKEGVPDSAYFAAHEAAKGIGDAFLFYAKSPTGEEIDLAVQRYRGAMSLFPFDRSVWSALAAALERQGREASYLELVQSSASAITSSRSLDRWIRAQEPGSNRIDKLRRAFSDSSALMYLGFGDGVQVEDLERTLAGLREERDALKTIPARRSTAADRAQLARLERKIRAHNHVLPIYRDTLESEGLAYEIRSRRDHPVHALLRRIYYELRG